MRAVIWDLDGTIADTEDIHYQAWRAVMPAYGVDYTYAMFLADFGRNNVEILTELLNDPDPDTIRRVADEKESAFRALVNSDSVTPLPGVVTWLRYFQSQGVRQVIGSSGSMANIAAVVAALDLGDYFQALLTGFGLPKGKPDPTLFRLCAAVAQAEPSQCLVIEDSIFGVEAAQRASMAWIAVGKLVSNERVRSYLEVSSGTPCLAVEQLTELAPDQIASLV